MQTPPKDIEAGVRWLLDRAAITDVLSEYSRVVDERDFDGWVALFTEDARFSEPFGSVPKTRMKDLAVAALAEYPLTVHHMTNMTIEIHGDSATVRRYLLAIHVLNSDDLGGHADVGGWYDVQLCRTDVGWRIADMRARFVYADGKDFPPPPDFPMDPPLD